MKFGTLKSLLRKRKTTNGKKTTKEGAKEQVVVLPATDEEESSSSADISEDGSETENEGLWDEITNEFFAASGTKQPQQQVKSSSAVALAPVSPVVTPHISATDAAMKFFVFLNDQNVKEMRKLFADDCQMEFPGISLSIDEYIKENINVFDAFPDFVYAMNQMRKTENPKEVVMEGCFAFGTHTGPFSFGPFPAIEPTYTSCKNDQEDIIIRVNEEGKIVYCKIEAKGELSGPPGFYKQIGGIME